MKFSFFLLLVVGFVPLLGRADETAATVGQSTSPSSPSVLNNFKASFTWFAYNLNSDMVLSDTNNRDGFNEVKIDNAPSIGYKLNADMVVNVSQTFRQVIDKNPNNPEVTALDPYLGFALNNIVKSNSGFKLDSQLRYYAPFSRATAQARDKVAATDAGRGTFRLTINPTQTFLGEAFTFNPAVLYYYRMSTHSDADRIKANGKPDRFDQRIYFDPSLSYGISPKLEVYVEYDSIIEHYTNSNYWSPSQLNSDIYLGVNWTPIKKLVINPAIYWSASETRADNGTKSYKLIQGIDYTQVMLQVVYTFL